MRYAVLAASVLIAATSGLAGAMPLRITGNARLMLIDDGCGAFAHAGINGHCQRDVQGWHHQVNGDNRPGALTYGPVFNGSGSPIYRNACPPSYHLGARSGLCRSNPAF